MSRLFQEKITEYNGGKEPVLPFAATDVFQADINDCRRLTAVDEGCKAVYEVTFDVTVCIYFLSILN